MEFARKAWHLIRLCYPRIGGSIREVKSVLENRDHARRWSPLRAMTESFYGNYERESTLKYYSYRKKATSLGNLMPIPTICLPRNLFRYPVAWCALPPLSSFLFVFPSSFSTSISLSANVLRRSRLWLEWRLFRISFR